MNSDSKMFLCVIAIASAMIVSMMLIGSVSDELARKHELAMASCDVVETSDE